MEIVKLTGARRAQKGRNALRHLRGSGFVPAVVYGGAGDSISISLLADEIEATLRTHHRVFELRIDDGAVEEVFLQDVQLDPLDDVVLHVDFKRVALDRPIKAMVALEFVGHPVGLTHGGKFEHDLTEVEVECLPKDLPQSIEVEVKHLGLDQSVTAGQMELPPGVRLTLPPEAVVCHIKQVRVAAAEEEEAVPGAEPAQPELIRKAKEEGPEGESRGREPRS